MENLRLAWQTWSIQWVAAKEQELWGKSPTNERNYSKDASFCVFINVLTHRKTKRSNSGAVLLREGPLLYTLHGEVKTAFLTFRWAQAWQGRDLPSPAAMWVIWPGPQKAQEAKTHCIFPSDQAPWILSSLLESPGQAWTQTLIIIPSAHFQHAQLSWEPSGSQKFTWAKK